MAKQFNRRDFLKRSVLSVGSFVLANSLQAINIFSNNTPNPLPTPDPNLMALYKQAKEYFYQKRYSDAILLFNQLITNNPDVLYVYDGLARVYGAQQKLQTVSELYLQGVNANPNNAFFLHRYGLSLRSLCLGNSIQAQNFASQHNIQNLYDTAAQQVLMAVSLDPKECFLLDLKDFVRLLEKYNNNSRNSSSPFTLSEEVISQIDNITNPISAKHTNTRASRKPNIPPENTLRTSLTNRFMDRRKPKPKRNLHSNHDREERERSERRSKKRVSYTYFRNSLSNNSSSNNSLSNNSLSNNSLSNNSSSGNVLRSKINVDMIEKWGMQILADDIKDTNSIGAMRHYFRKNKHFDRIISINRYFYNNSESIYAALALATSLVKYGNNASSLNEAKQLLDHVSPHVANFTSITKGSYYITTAKIQIKENNQSVAQAALLEGLDLFDGRGGVAYSLMETYATTFNQSDATKAIDIQKALCNKPVTKVNDPVWNYIENYRNFLNEIQINKTEEIKALIALSKLQRKFNDSGYNATINEINTLKNS